MIPLLQTTRTENIFATALGPVIMGLLLNFGVSFSAIAPATTALGAIIFAGSFWAREFVRKAV
jgi:uncharacterized membrane protein YgdD (TMEM256/DUF423 family)